MKSNYKNNYFSFFFLFVSAIVVNYYTPTVLRTTYFIILLVSYYFSKNTSYWFAFFYCIIYAPGYLFNIADENHCLPFFGLPMLGKDIAFIEILVIVTLVKSIKFSNHTKINKSFFILIAFSLVLLIVTAIFESSSTKIARTIRFLIPYSLLWSIPRLIDKRGMLIVFKYFLAFTIPIILCQLYVISNGQHLMFLLGGSFSGNKELLNDLNFDANNDLIRPSYSTHLLLINVFFCCYNFLTKEKSQNKYNLFFLVLTLISFTMTGTRGYFLGSVSIIFICILIDYKALAINSLKILFVILSFLCLLTVPKIGTQLSLALERISTLQSLANGDATAGGTLIRLTERLPKVMEKVNDSPILGYGFSDIYYKNADGHVANATLLLNGGIIGLIVFIVFIVSIMDKIYKSYLFSGRREFLAVNAGLIGFIVVHSTSYMVFSYLFGQPNYLCFTLLLCFANIVIEETKLNGNNNSLLQKKINA